MSVEGWGYDLMLASCCKKPWDFRKLIELEAFVEMKHHFLKCCKCKQYQSLGKCCSFLMDFKPLQKSSCLTGLEGEEGVHLGDSHNDRSQRVSTGWDVPLVPCNKRLCESKTLIQTKQHVVFYPKHLCIFFIKHQFFVHYIAEHHIINWHVTCNIHHRKLYTFTMFHLFSSLTSLTTSRRVGSSPAHASKRWMKDCRPWGKLNRRRKRNLERSTTKWISSDFIFSTFP